jgi:excisionase family DNA binding protein
MQILTPEDRVVLWRKTIESGADERELMRKILAREALDSAGSKLDLYEGYEDLFVDSFRLLDASGYLGRDDLRAAFEEAASDEAASLFIALLADYVRQVADIERLDAESRILALELAARWRDILVEHPGEEEGWLSVAQVAARFGVTPQAVYKWIRDGKIDFEERPGGSYRVPAGQFMDRGAAHRRRVLDLQKRLVAERGAARPVEDEELVAELRARRRS